VRFNFFTISVVSCQVPDRAVCAWTFSWPDNDQAGSQYARVVAKQAIAAGALTVKIISPPRNSDPGWDANDALAQGWGESHTADLILAASPAEKQTWGTSSDSADDQSANNRQRSQQGKTLIGLCDFVELWHDPSGVAYGTFTVGAHKEHRRLDSEAFKRWLTHRCYEKAGFLPGSHAVDASIKVLEHDAITKGNRYTCFRRVGIAELAPLHRLALRSGYRRLI
jgi:putative DNA primase/helicase